MWLRERRGHDNVVCRLWKSTGAQSLGRMSFSVAFVLAPTGSATAFLVQKRCAD